jgi:multiple sugar transport system permease protein
MVDGATRLRALFSITLPLILPGLAATAIFTFLLSWNDFTMAFFLTSTNGRTMPVLAASFRTENGMNWGPAAAYGVIMIIPALLFAFFAQRYLVSGLTLGATKG